MWRLYGNGGVIIQSPHPRIEMAQISYDPCPASIQRPHRGVSWLCDHCVVLGSCVLNVYNFSFLTEITPKTCKTKGRKEKRFPRYGCSITIQFYGHGTGFMWQPCDCRAGTIQLSLEPTITVHFFVPNLKSCVLCTISVWPPCSALTG